MKMDDNCQVNGTQALQERTYREQRGALAEQLRYKRKV